MAMVQWVVVAVLEEAQCHRCLLVQLLVVEEWLMAACAGAP